MLKTDKREGGWTDEEISEAYSCTVNTVENVRKRFCDLGFQVVLDDKKRASPPRERKFDGEAEAAVIATRLSEPPDGCANWTLELLQERIVALSIVDSVSKETVRKTLKKNEMTQRKIPYWVIPPKQNAQFAANMENILGIYKKQYDERFPVICMDEQPVQLLEEVNIPIAATKNHAPPGRLRI